MDDSLKLLKYFLFWVYLSENRITRQDLLICSISDKYLEKSDPSQGFIPQIIWKMQTPFDLVCTWGIIDISKSLLNFQHLNVLESSYRHYLKLTTKVMIMSTF
jgi:hypothetical protein